MRNLKQICFQFNWPPGSKTDIEDCGEKMCAGLRYVPGLMGADWSQQEVENAKRRLWEMYKNPYGFIIKKGQVDSSMHNSMLLSKIYKQNQRTLMMIFVMISVMFLSVCIVNCTIDVKDHFCEDLDHRSRSP